MARYGFTFILNDCTKGNETKLLSSLGKAGIKYFVYRRDRQEQNIQGYLQSNIKNKERFYKRLGLYVTPQKGSATEARDKYKKNADFKEGGKFNSEIKGTTEKRQGERTDIMEIQSEIKEGKSYDEIVDAHFGKVAGISGFIKEQIQHRDCQSRLTEIRNDFRKARLRPWQQELQNKIQGEPSPREILWYWEKNGNTGKSWMARYLMATENAIILSCGKKADMALSFAKNISRIVIFDLSRTQEAKEGARSLDAIYSLAEEMKNGCIVSTKYASRTVYFKPPHVIFFANFQPDMFKWSRDRYVINNIDSSP